MKDFASQIAGTKDEVAKASEGLLKTFAFVPDDKLGWSPSETARSPLWIVGHCAAANDAFARGIRGEAFPPMSMEEFGRMVWLAGKDTKTRDEAAKALEDSTAGVLAALDALTEDRMGAAVQSPFGPIPVAYWMTFAGGHMMGHSNQVEYIQTIWGDHQPHMM